MLVSLVSLKGAPGVTRLAVSLAAVWPGGTPALLLECDLAGGTLAARYGLASSPSLTTLAAASFRRPDPDLFATHQQELPGQVPVVIAPADAAKAAAAVADLAGPGALLPAVRGSSRVVLADCGRLDVTSPTPVVGLADIAVVVARPVPEDIVLLPPAVDALRKAGNPLLLVLRGSGHAVRNVARVLDVPALSVPEVAARRFLARPDDLAYARATLQLAHELIRLTSTAEVRTSVTAP